MSGAAWPCYYRWSGDVMEPLPRFRHRAIDQFVIGQTYRLMVEEERSQATHRHFFACINEAWKNLPDDLAQRFATAEHLRKWALVKCGFHDERTLVMETPADARRTAAFIAKLDDQGVIIIKGNIVSHYTAKSQAIRAMDRKTFQESKEAVLELVAEMIGLTAAQLASEVKKQGYHDDPEPETEPSPEFGGQKVIDNDPNAGRAAYIPANMTPAGDPAPAATTTAPRKERTTKPRKPAVTVEAEPPRATTLERDKPPTSKAVQRIADRAEATAKAANRPTNVHCAKCGTVYAVQPDRCDACGSANFAATAQPPTKTALKSPADYIAYARAWIDTAETHERGMIRWDEESELRNQLKVPIKERTQLQSRIDIKFGA